MDSNCTLLLAFLSWHLGRPALKYSSSSSQPPRSNWVPNGQNDVRSRNFRIENFDTNLPMNKTTRFLKLWLSSSSASRSKKPNQISSSKCGENGNNVSDYNSHSQNWCQSSHLISWGFWCPQLRNFATISTEIQDSEIFLEISSKIITQNGREKKISDFDKLEAQNQVKIGPQVVLNVEIMILRSDDSLRGRGLRIGRKTVSPRKSRAFVYVSQHSQPVVEWSTGLMWYIKKWCVMKKLSYLELDFS